MRNVRLVTLTLFALTLAGAPALAQGTRPGRRTITGVVVDSSSGRPLALAVVDLGRREVVTDSTGRFRFDDVADGAVTLSAEQLGYRDRDLDLTVGQALGPVRLALEADPVKLAAITVMSDRFRSRRNATPVAVQAFNRAELLTSGAFSLKDFLQYRGGFIAQGCSGGEPSLGGGPFGGAFSGGADGGGLCVLSRGQWVEPSVWIDERPAFSDELVGYNPSDLFLVEVYAHGRMIRAYTTWWIESAGRHPLDPIW